VGEAIRVLPDTARLPIRIHACSSNPVIVMDLPSIPTNSPPELSQVICVDCQTGRAELPSPKPAHRTITQVTTLQSIFNAASEGCKSRTIFKFLADTARSSGWMSEVGSTRYSTNGWYRLSREITQWLASWATGRRALVSGELQKRATLPTSPPRPALLPEPMISGSPAWSARSSLVSRVYLRAAADALAPTLMKACGKRETKNEARGA